MIHRTSLFVIREYRPADAPQIGELFFASVRDLGPRSYTPEQVAAWAPAQLSAEAVQAKAGDGRITLVAVGGAGEVVAFGDLEADGHIDHLYCHPDAAGTGVAGQVLDALLDRAVAAGPVRVFTEASELARGLFERKGFRAITRCDFVLRGVSIHNYAMERVAPHPA